VVYACVERSGEEGVDGVLVVMQPVAFWRIDCVGRDGERGGVGEESCDDVRDGVV